MGAGEVGRLVVKKGYVEDAQLHQGKRLIPVCLMCGYLYTLDMNIQGGEGGTRRNKSIQSKMLKRTEYKMLCSL